MSWSGTTLIKEFQLNGVSAGIQVDGYLRVLRGIISPAPTGLILQDANGVYWQLSVDSNGVLSTTEITL